MIKKWANIVNALLVILMSFQFLRMIDLYLMMETARSANESGLWLHVTDAMIGLLVVGPLAVGITYILFWRFDEQRTLANVMTVFSAVFGVFSCFYFLWTLRY